MTTQNVKQFSFQSLFEATRNLLEYVARPVIRIFSPTHDDYPEVGMQPYEGDPADPDL